MVLELGLVIKRNETGIRKVQISYRELTYHSEDKLCLVLYCVHTKHTPLLYAAPPSPLCDLITVMQILTDEYFLSAIVISVYINEQNS